MIKIEPVKDPHDARLKFLEHLGMSFKKIDNIVLGNGIRDLTSDTSKALNQTLNDIPARQGNARYILPRKLQSDRLEAEFGIIRDSSGGNFLIHAEQAISSLQLQHLKLLSKLKVIRVRHKCIFRTYRGSCEGEYPIKKEFKQKEKHLYECKNVETEGFKTQTMEQI